MSVDLWTMENVANVKMLPVPVFNTNEAWGRVRSWSEETKNSSLELQTRTFLSSSSPKTFTLTSP
jgi:hypothetical protein